MQRDLLEAGGKEEISKANPCLSQGRCLQRGPHPLSGPRAALQGRGKDRLLQEKLCIIGAQDPSLALLTTRELEVEKATPG